MVTREDILIDGSASWVINGIIDELRGNVLYYFTKRHEPFNHHCAVSIAVVDLFAVTCERYEIYPDIDPSIIHIWREDYLTAFDDWFQGYVNEEILLERNIAIEAFDHLERIILMFQKV